MTEKEMIQKIYEVIKLVDCLQYNPSVDFNYLRAKGAYNIIKNRIENIEAENTELKATISKMETVEKELLDSLERVVELKAKVGDVIYMPWEYDGNDGIATLQIIKIDIHNYLFIYITNLQSDNMDYLAKYKHGIFCDKDFDNTIFTNRAAAEKRLAELKGG